MSNVVAFVPRQSSTSATEQHLQDWLDLKTSEHTRRYYESDVRAMLETVGKPVQQIVVRDLINYFKTLDHLADTSKVRHYASIKSFFTFLHTLGVISINIGKLIKAPKAKDTLAERILTEADVHAMILQTPAGRDQTMLRVLYRCGLRISEAAGLSWVDVHPSFINVFGKGNHTRQIAIDSDLYNELLALRASQVREATEKRAAGCEATTQHGGASDTDPVFRSRKSSNGGRMDESAVHRVVKAAAERCGLSDAVSAHWLRHSHATHALDAGETVHSVMLTLGHASLNSTSRYVHLLGKRGSALTVKA